MDSKNNSNYYSLLENLIKFLLHYKGDEFIFSLNIGLSLFNSSLTQLHHFKLMSVISLSLSKSLLLY